MSFISGNLQWHGDLAGLSEIIFKAQIVFNEPGNQTIEATASHITDNKEPWNALDTISLNFGPYGIPDSTLPDRRVNYPTASCGALREREPPRSGVRTGPLSSPQQAEGYSAVTFIK